MVILTQKRRELLSTRLTELGNYTIASLFISRFLVDTSFDIGLAILGGAVAISLHVAGLIFSR